MKMFIDSEYHCHTTNPDGIFRLLETDFFEGRCAEFIEGYFFIPIGEKMTDSDGIPILGEMIAPWKDYSELDAAQRKYERQLLADYESALAEIEAALGV